ncbi:MAG: T9SS type A sorting domain-containing protein [Bacteroidales bacterium]|nr:T9SS type A sorting domain-containing protein [Bacteroidales bacterium]
MKKQITILIALLALLGWSKITVAQSIAAGGWHSVVVCSDNTVKCFGENATGQLGNGNNTDQNLPVSVAGLTGVIAVSAGGDQLEAHSMALKSDGTVWTWGSNLYGALGNATTTSTNTPVQSLLLTNVTAISAGGWHSVALKDDGTVWTWGWNEDGQLGDGSITSRIIAGQVPGLTNVIAIAAGTYHVLALKDDGTVWAWGDNISGQIGNGSTTDVSSPVQVSGLSGVVKIAAGRFFSLAVKSDGTVWTWGENLYGQLGNGTTTDSHVPVQVSGLTGITSATAATGAFHCMAVKNDNTVWAWGRNTYGNLGDGSVTHKSTPVQMSGISDVVGLAAGTNFSLLYKSDGTLWGCGRNASGQLGDGTFLQRNTVTQATSMCPILQPAGISTLHNSEITQITAFPNPSSDGIFKIEITDENGQLKNGIIEVFNVIGKNVFQASIDSKILTSNLISIDLSQQANGIYFMTFTKESHKFYQKLLKQ